MSRFMKFSLSVIVAFTILFAQGCSVIPQGIKNIFASKTPIPTNTPTITPTATITPRPPIFPYPCKNLNNCPEAVPLDDFLGYPASFDYPNNIEIPYNQVVNINMDWIVSDQQILDETSPFIKWIFTIDGYDYLNEDWLFFQDTQDMDNPNIKYPGKWLSVNLGNWKVGEKHEIRIGLILEKSMSDGWVDLPAGHTAIKTYVITPIKLPTTTPNPTSTPKPTVTLTPRPAAPAATQANIPSNDNAEVEHRLGTVPVTITNNKSVAVKIVAVGPTTYTVTVPAGQTIQVKWAPGNYALTAYVNGSYYASTTWNVNENHALFTIN